MDSSIFEEDEALYNSQSSAITEPESDGSSEEDDEPVQKKPRGKSHVRQVDKRLAGFSKELKAKLREEFHLLQYVRDDEEFTKVAGLLFDSWPHDCKDFVSYLCDVWISSSERFWYEAAHPFGSTNNGLEAHNRLIKAAHTLRNLLPMPQFLKNAVEVVNGWSMRSVDPASGPEAKPYVFKEAYELSKSGRIWQKIDGQDTYVFASEGAHIGNKEDLAAAYAEFMNIELNNFDDFKKTRFKVHVVRMAATGDHFKCSCPIGAKKNACKHAIMVSCLKPVALLTYPPDAVSVMLMKKKKPGRPSQKPVGRPRLAEKQNRHATAN